MTIEDRRSFPRLAFKVDVQYKSIAQGEQKSSSVVFKNIGSGGVCLEMLEQLEIGTNLELNFFLPESKTPIAATGKVIWIKEYLVSGNNKALDTGIQFIEIKEEDRKKIDQYVTERF